MARKSWNVAKITKRTFDGIARQEHASGDSANPKPSNRFCGSVRMTYTICAFLSMVVHICMRNTLSFSILCMVKSTHEESHATGMQSARTQCEASGSAWLQYFTSNASEIERSGDLDWTRSQSLTLQGTFFYGYILTMPLAGHLADKFGGKLLFVHSMTLQSICFVFLPMFARLGYGWAVVLMILQGLFAGCGNPALYQLFVVWAHPTERSALLSFAYGGYSVGALLANPLSSFLCAYGWDNIFYTIGIISFLFGISCLCLVYSTLEQHPRISAAESAYLKPAKVIMATNGKVPWKSILRSLPVYAFTLTHIFHTYGVMVLMLMLPRFFKEAMGFSLSEVGLLSSAPFMGSLVAKALSIASCSYIEKKPNVNLTVFRRLIYVFCNTVTCLCIGVIIYADCHQKMLVVLMTVIIGISTDIGFSGVYWPSLLYFAPSSAGLLSGFANGLASCCGFIAPLGIALIVKQGTKAEWDLVMLSLVIFYTVGGIVFGLFSSSKLQSWDLSQQNVQKSMSNNGDTEVTPC